MISVIECVEGFMDIDYHQKGYLKYMSLHCRVIYYDHYILFIAGRSKTKCHYVSWLVVYIRWAAVVLPTEFNKLNDVFPQVQMAVDVRFAQDTLRGDNVTEIRMKFIKRIEENLPAGDEWGHCSDAAWSEHHAAEVCVAYKTLLIPIRVEHLRFSQKACHLSDL